MSLAPETRKVSAGEDLRLECEVEEAGEVVWLKGTDRIQPSGRIQVFCQDQRQTLVIRGFSAEDQGEYRCGPAVNPASASAIAFQGAFLGGRLGGALGYGNGEWSSATGVRLGSPPHTEGD